MRRNIANFTTLNNVMLNKLEIQSSDIGLAIYAANSDTPAYTFNPNTRQTYIAGDIDVEGIASFTSINVSEYLGSMFALSTDNISDIRDIGIVGTYINGTKKYAGIARDASDSLKRWTFFENIDTNPISTVEPINDVTLASARMNFLYINDGLESLPSLAFDSDTGKDTGFYRIAENNIGITTNGVKRIDIGNSSTIITNELQTLSGYKKQLDIITGTSLTLTTSHHVVEFSYAGNVTVTLPLVSANIGRTYILIKTNIGILTVSTSGSDCIDNGVSTSLILDNRYDRTVLICGSTQWYTV